MDERFRVKKVGDAYEITQRTVDVRPGEFILQVRDEIARKADMIKQQIMDMPRQKEIMEKDIAQLEKRLGAIEPFVKEIQAEMEEKRKELEEKKDKVLSASTPDSYVCKDNFAA